MDFNDRLADLCGVKVNTVYKWNRYKNFPKYAELIKRHIWNGEIFHDDWKNYRINGKYLVNNLTGHYISNTEINRLWVVKQKLQYQYEMLMKNNNVEFELKLEKI